MVDVVVFVVVVDVGGVVDSVSIKVTLSDRSCTGLGEMVPPCGAF